MLGGVFLVCACVVVQEKIVSFPNISFSNENYPHPSFVAESHSLYVDAFDIFPRKIVHSADEPAHVTEQAGSDIEVFFGTSCHQQSKNAVIVNFCQSVSVPGHLAHVLADYGPFRNPSCGLHKKPFGPIFFNLVWPYSSFSYFVFELFVNFFIFRAKRVHFNYFFGRVIQFHHLIIFV